MPRSQLTPGVRRAGSVMGSSHQKVMTGAAEELSLKRKGGSGSLGLNYFRLLKLYVLPLYQMSLLSRSGGTWEPSSLCWLVTTSIRLLLVASPLDAPHSVQSWLPHFLLVFFQITSTSSQTLKGHVLCRTTLKDSSAYCWPERMALGLTWAVLADRNGDLTGHSWKR